MTSIQTGRHRLPLLAVSQAQKEITHNEALVIIDALLHPVVENVLANAPTVTDADLGKCWLVGPTPAGIWSDRADSLAVYIGGGWRYLPPPDGMRIWNRFSECHVFRIDGQWITGPSITDPANGSVIDAEARSALVAILQYFRLIGLLTP